MIDVGYSVVFSACGVTIRVDSNRADLIKWVRSRLDTLLPRCVDSVDDESRAAGHVFAVHSEADGSVSLSYDGEPLGSNPSRDVALQYLATRIKLTVGAFATSHVFVHAGVVAIGGGAIVMPGASFQGKTTLVRELVLRGAVYYSDDFALVDPEGRVSPFPKALSVREHGESLPQVERSVESLGGVVGDGPLQVDAVLCTHYDRDARDAPWKPARISQAETILQLTPHTLSMRVDPERSLRVLGEMVAEARRGLWQSPRGEAREVVDWIFGTYQPNGSPTRS